MKDRLTNLELSFEIGETVPSRKLAEDSEASFKKSNYSTNAIFSKLTISVFVHCNDSVLLHTVFPMVGRRDIFAKMQQ